MNNYIDEWIIMVWTIKKVFINIKIITNMNLYLKYRKDKYLNLKLPNSFNQSISVIIFSEPSSLPVPAFFWVLPGTEHSSSWQFLFDVSIRTLLIDANRKCHHHLRWLGHLETQWMLYHVVLHHGWLLRLVELWYSY